MSEVLGYAVSLIFLAVGLVCVLQVGYSVGFREGGEAMKADLLPVRKK